MTQNQKPQQTKPKKKNYQRPELSVFGSVAKLTEAHSGGAPNDHGRNQMGISVP